MNDYRVWVSGHSNYKVKAQNARNARLRVWNMVKNGFTYGWTKSDFLENATTEKL